MIAFNEATLEYVDAELFQAIPGLGAIAQSSGTSMAFRFHLPN